MIVLRTLLLKFDCSFEIYVYFQSKKLFTKAEIIYGKSPAFRVPHRLGGSAPAAVVVTDKFGGMVNHRAVALIIDAGIIAFGELYANVLSTEHLPRPVYPVGRPAWLTAEKSLLILRNGDKPQTQGDGSLVLTKFSSYDNLLQRCLLCQDKPE